ncbi:hypothetical protein HY477_00410, partial [Candidatus Uhrbacteria bacterium]|nr:hypothetical protein [Candidatus Uhrbacteria bacterium]
PKQAYISGGSGNAFNLSSPTGGNYWNNFDEPLEGCNDLNQDNFCDTPYVFSGGQDNLPWTKQDGWLAPQNQPPTPTDLTQSTDIIGEDFSESSSIREAAITFSARIEDSDGDPTRLEVELRRFEEAFTGANDGGILSSDPISSGEIATITRHGLAPGFYHWRARAVDASGTASEWAEFGIAGNIDFEIMAHYLVELDQGQQYRVYYQSFRTEEFGQRTPIFSARQFTDSQGNLIRDPVLAKKIAMTAYIYEKITNPQFAVNIEQGAKGANDMLKDFLAVTTIETLEKCIPSAGAAVILGPASTLNCVLKQLKDTVVLDSLTGVNLVRIIAMSLTEDLKDRYDGIEQKTGPFINGEAVIDYNSATTTFNMLYKGTFLIEPLSTDLLFKLGKMDSGPWDQFFQLIYNATLGLFDVVFMTPDSQESALVSTFTPAAHANWDYTSALNYLATNNRLPQYAGVFDKLTDVLGAVGNLTDTAEDFSARYQFVTALQQAIDNWGVKIANEDQSYIEVAKLSPGELRVFDGEGHVTGLREGVIVKEIPGSDYIDGRVWLPDTSQSYRYEVVGTAPGLYGLDFQRVDSENITKFGAVDISMSTSTIHEYQIDWQALVAGEDGVTLEVDRNGDGVFENVVTADSTLTADEFALQTNTVIDLVPDTLNLRSMGKVVTAYIELPQGFDVSQIDISSIRLNLAIPALVKPTSVGDYDNDGTTDLMVKFDGEKVRQLLLDSGQVAKVRISGKVFYDGGDLDFAGVDYVRLIR